MSSRSEKIYPLGADDIEAEDNAKPGPATSSVVIEDKKAYKAGHVSPLKTEYGVGSIVKIEESICHDPPAKFRGMFTENAGVNPGI